MLSLFSLTIYTAIFTILLTSVLIWAILRHHDLTEWIIGRVRPRDGWGGRATSDYGWNTAWYTNWGHLQGEDWGDLAVQDGDDNNGWGPEPDAEDLRPGPFHRAEPWARIEPDVADRTEEFLLILADLTRESLPANASTAEVRARHDTITRQILRFQSELLDQIFDPQPLYDIEEEDAEP